MTMREKMARAMCARVGVDPDKPGIRKNKTGEIDHPPMWRLQLPLVDACLDALMDPTQEMITKALGDVIEHANGVWSYARLPNDYGALLRAASIGK